MSSSGKYLWIFACPEIADVGEPEPAQLVARVLCFVTED
jgi:hypothetical protein